MSSGIDPHNDAAPRLSASLIIINDRNELLLVHRNPSSRSFSGMHVFPGGNSDAAQDGGSHEMTAIRETFEETGLLLASPKSAQNSGPALGNLDSARRAVHSGRLLFKDFLSEQDLVPDVSSLLPFSQWVTPAPASHRFHTHFFVTFLPMTTSAGFSPEDTQRCLPTPDGGREIIEARFAHPLDALSEYKRGRISLVPPQFYLITLLAEILQSRRTSKAERARVEWVSKRSAFGRMVVHPLWYTGPEVPVDCLCLTYEGDEARGGPKGRLHRSLMRADNGVGERFCT